MSATTSETSLQDLSESKVLLPKTSKDEKLRLLDNEYAPNEVNVNMENLASNEYNEALLNRELEHPTSDFDTMIHLLKGNIGTGILAMPDAFRNAGWFVGLFGTLFMGYICTHCMHMLVGCSHELCRRIQKPFLSFPEVVEVAFKTGPETIRPYSGMAKITVDVFLCITQLGFCCVYFVFVAANLHDVIKHYYMDISVHTYLVIILVPMIFLNFVKNLKYLTPASLFASIVTCIGLVIIFFYTLQDLPHLDTIDAFGKIEELPLYFGTVIYAFEGIGVVLPLENNMKKPENFSGWTGVLNTSMIIVACLYTAIGFFGYLKYGEKAVLGSITLLLPAGDLLAQSVRLMMAVAIFLSYSLQFYVVVNIVLVYVQNFFNTEKSLKIAEYVTRISLVFITFGLAVCIPNLGVVISLVGAFSSSALALIFPPFIEIITFSPDRLGRNNWMLWKDLAIMIFGFIGFILGTYVSVLNIIQPKI